MNEIWLAITDFADGSTTSIASTTHATRTDAQSIVVHRLDGALNPKIACATLVRETPYPPMVTAGPATVLPGGAGLELVGTATMTRTLAGVTEVSVEASGLTAGETYSVHVHDQPCSVDAGGGHYVRDRAAATGEANEIWLALAADASGAALDSIRVAHLARAEARSAVLHAADGARLACFDLR